MFWQIFRLRFKSSPKSGIGKLNLNSSLHCYEEKPGPEPRRLVVRVDDVLGLGLFSGGHARELHLLDHAPDGDEQQREPLNSAQLPLEQNLKGKSNLTF